MSKDAAVKATDLLLIGISDDRKFTAELQLIAEFRQDGKSFNYHLDYYWAQEHLDAIGKIELKVGDEPSKVLTETAITNGENHKIEGRGDVITPFQKVNLEFVFTFTFSHGATVEAKGKRELVFPWP
jgi:hypothetical protein